MSCRASHNFADAGHMQCSFHAYAYVIFTVLAGDISYLHTQFSWDYEWNGYLEYLNVTIQLQEIL